MNDYVNETNILNHIKISNILSLIFKNKVYIEQGIM